MKILVVNNYGQFNHLIHRSIRDKVETRIVSNETPAEDIVADGMILGGGPSMERAGRCSEYLRMLDIPVLGICLGLQIMAVTFGGKVETGRIGGYANVEIEVLEEDGILKGLPCRFMAWASHADQVTICPEEFRVIARSSICEIEAICHESRPLYGVQWHPEVAHTEHGEKVFDNFLEICRR